MNSTATHIPGRRARGAFTLTELLVAVGAVAILTVGIGRIFASVNDLVTTGAAIAELDQTARTIEQRMREDFEALSAMNADETFMAIRMREIGHEDRPIYLTPEDRQFDLQNGLTPYADESRAVHRRLDEIVFLAGDGAADAFTSRQADGFFTSGAVREGVARLYWGHGLKPKLDPDYPAQDPADRFPQDDDAPRVRPRVYEPDGYFGDRPGEDESTLNPKIDRVTGRNEYAAEWTLVRQPLLLVGSQASGEIAGFLGDPLGPFSAMAGNPTGDAFGGGRREYAPYIRDNETFARVWPALGLANEFNEFGNSEAYPDPRLIRHGRVDILAQDRDGVQRFLEGEPAEADGGSRAGESALVNPFFTSARLGRDPGAGSLPNTNETFVLNEIQAPLWRWPEEGTGGNPAAQVIGARNRYWTTLTNIRSAIAGTIIRPLVEIEPPALDHIFDTGTDAFDEETPENALMDNHAVIAPRCSSFSIAWSDGSRAREIIDLDDNGVPEFFPGDLLWYDITRVDPADPNEWRIDSIERSVLETLRGRDDFIEWGIGEYQGNTPRPDDPEGRHVNPSIVWNNQSQQLNVEDSLGTGDPFTIPDKEAAYNADMTGGAPSWIASPDTFEHLVIFPFRDSVRDATAQGGVGFVDGRSGAWAKPRFIRVRMTLHDPQNRIEGGRDYEFVFPIRFAQNLSN